MTKAFQARVYVRNPGGAYDPAPMEDLDMEAAGTLPAIGDFIYRDLKDERQVFEVKTRHWRDGFVGIVVVQVEPPSDSPFF